MNVSHRLQCLWVKLCGVGGGDDDRYDDSDDGEENQKCKIRTMLNYTAENPEAIIIMICQRK